MRNMFFVVSAMGALAACSPTGVGFTGIGGEPGSAASDTLAVDPLNSTGSAAVRVGPEVAARAFRADVQSTALVSLDSQQLRMEIRQDDARRYAVLENTTGGVLTPGARAEFARLDYVLTGCAQASDWVAGAEPGSGSAVALDCG